LKKRKNSKANTTPTETTTVGQKATDLDLEETGGFVEPNQRSFVYPRLFVVHNDGTAKELLSRF